MRKLSVALCLCFLLHNAAATFPVTEFLKKHETEFFSVVNARLSLLRLKRKGVITQDIESRISTATNDEDAQEILFAHLLHHAEADTLLTYCEVIIAANGYPRMQSLGIKIKEDLESMQGGWLCACVRARVCLCVCKCAPVGILHCACVVVCVLFCNKLSFFWIWVCYVLYTCTHTYVYNMVHILCIVCTVSICMWTYMYMCAYLCVAVCAH